MNMFVQETRGAPSSRFLTSSFLSWGLRLIVLSAMLSFAACGGEVVISVPGCEQCPGRCIESDGRGSCVECLQDKQCQSAGSPTRKCQDNKCICGSNQDCPERKVCDGKNGCVDCLDDKDCTSKDKPVCVNKVCGECKAGAERACAPDGTNPCVKGTQKCRVSGVWGKCEGYLVCKEKDRCVQNKCLPPCPEPAVCKKDDKVCITGPDEKPGAYRECGLSDEQCYVLKDEKKFCGRGEVCEKGQCIPFSCPKVPCKEGETVCVDKDSYRTCGRDKNNCVVWLENKACPANQQCQTKLKKCTFCVPGSKQKCFDGKDKTLAGVGECKQGEQICKDDGSAFGECKKQVLPAKETCNDKDDDCDGAVDEDFATKGDTCQGGSGACENKGKMICKPNGLGVQCNVVAGKPKPEDCNGIDDDCDGKVDNISGQTSPLQQSCYGAPSNTIGVGGCKEGKQTCTNSRWSKCENSVVPKTEECNGKDDDCDGKTDEDFTKLGTACQNGVGDCVRPGKFICDQSGASVTCDAKPGQPNKETCDGKDNDCNGKIDETFTKLGTICQVGKGECVAPGKYVCAQNGGDVECSGTPLQPKKELCDGKDNDCDGQTDEDFPDLNKSCKLGVGACQSTGKNICNQKQDGVVCDGLAGSANKEVCNNKDDDCDGLVDERLERQCYAAGSGCTKQADGTYNCKGTCQAGKQRCSGGVWSLCVGAVTPASGDVCDGKDNNCNGQIDENNPGGGKDCSLPNAYALCRQAKTACEKGKVICKQVNFPKTEVCDGADNDCDGKVDEGIAVTAYYPDTDKDGFGDKNARAVIRCKQQQPAGTVPNNADCNDKSSAINPNAREVCDGVDNNCKNGVDEGHTRYNWYADLDKDGYGTSAVSFTGCIKSSTEVCTGTGACRSRSGFVNRSGDCCDKDRNARPNQTSYFTTKNACGNFDYNCNRRDEPNRTPCACSRSVYYYRSGYVDSEMSRGGGRQRWQTFNRAGATYTAPSCVMELTMSLRAASNKVRTSSDGCEYCTKQIVIPITGTKICTNVPSKPKCRRSVTLYASRTYRSWTPRPSRNRYVMWLKSQYRSGCAYKTDGYKPRCGERVYVAGGLERFTYRQSYSNRPQSGTLYCRDVNGRNQCGTSYYSYYNYTFEVSSGYVFTNSGTTYTTLGCR